MLINKVNYAFTKDTIKFIIKMVLNQETKKTEAALQQEFESSFS